VMLSFEAMKSANLLEGDVVMVMLEGDLSLKTLAQVEVDPIEKQTEVQVSLGQGVQLNLGMQDKQYEVIKLIYINPDKWFSELEVVELKPVSIKEIN